MCSLTHTRTLTHIYSEPLCVSFCSFSALTQLQFAVRQDSQGWSKKCQHVLHLTFLLLGSPLRLSAFILSWSSELTKRRSCSAIYQQPDSCRTARGEHFTYICNLFVSAQVLCRCRTFGVHCGSAACKSRAMAAVALPVM